MGRWAGEWWVDGLVGGGRMCRRVGGGYMPVSVKMEALRGPGARGCTAPQFVRTCAIMVEVLLIYHPAGQACTPLLFAGVLFEAAQHQPPLALSIDLAEPGPRSATRLWAAVLEELIFVEGAVRTFCLGFI